MAPKRKGKGVAGKKAALQSAEPDAQLDPGYLQQRQKLIANLEAQVLERQQNLRSLGDEAVSALRQEYRVQMLNLPKLVREMPRGIFRQKYGGDIHSIVLEEVNSRQQAAAAVGAPPATAVRGRRQKAPHAPESVSRTTRKDATTRAPLPMQGVAETPAVVAPSASFTPAVPGTLQRAPQLGEMFYSSRGSPLGVFERDPRTQQGTLSTVMRGARQAGCATGHDQHMLATIIKRPYPGSKTGVADAIIVTAKDGSSIEVDFNGGIQKLPKQQQAEATAHLTAISKRIDSMLGRKGTVATRRR